MEISAFRNICALVAHDFGDAVRNPTTLMSCATGVLLTVFIGTIAAGSSRLTLDESEAFSLVAAFCIAPAFTGCVMELYVMAEERERGAYITLVEAGVSVGEIAVAKWLAATLATLISQAVACLLLGFVASEVAVMLALALVGIQPLLLAGLACGLTAREQMSSSLLAVPLTAVAVAPILAFMSQAVRAVTWFWPLGSAAELLRAAGGMQPVVPVPLLVGIVVLRIVIAAVLVGSSGRRFARELAVERDRLG